MSLYLLGFCKNRNNIFCTGSYKELIPEEICLRNPRTQTKSLELLRKWQFNTSPIFVTSITQDLMPHPAVQIHPLQIPLGQLWLSPTNEQQTVAQASGTLCTLPRAVRQACSCDIVARTSKGGEKAKLFRTRWHMQGVFQQNSLFDQLVQALSVNGRCIFLACQFKEFVSNSLIIKLLEESMIQLFLAYSCKITQCNSRYQHFK